MAETIPISFIWNYIENLLVGNLFTSLFKQRLFMKVSNTKFLIVNIRNSS